MQATPPPRNVIVLLADDLAARATGFGGNEMVRTPRLDELARRSTIFDRAYSPSGWCMPSRASLLCGRYPHSTGVTENGPALLPDGPTYASELRALGFATATIGKWHSRNRNFEELGFDDYAVLPVPPSPGSYDEPRERSYLIPGGTEVSALDLTEYFTQKACGFIRKHREGRFLLSLNYNLPHRSGELDSEDLWFPAPGHAELYDAERIRLPSRSSDDLAHKPSYQRADRAHALFARYSESSLRRNVAHYYSLIGQLDAAIGQLIDLLAELELLDSTLIVFASDNGIFLGEHQMLLKGDLLYEEQMRVPFLCFYPPLTGAGRRCKRPVQLLGLGPTLIEAAGGEIPDAMQGRSFHRLLGDPDTAEWPDEALLENADLRGLATSRYKYTEAPDGSLELYDLHSDPFELENLSGRAEHRELVAQMKERLLALRMQEGDLSEDR